MKLFSLTLAASFACLQPVAVLADDEHHKHGDKHDDRGDFKPEGNRANHYGGRWVEGGVHSDWGNGGEHYWNHHHYRWYDGGWLIIDTGPVYTTPVYTTGYAPRGSLAARVQERLAERGYYRGPIDGDIGPGSSRAIANYQADHGLRVTGYINDRLIESLGL